MNWDWLLHALYDSLLFAGIMSVPFALLLWVAERRHRKNQKEEDGK